jgi:hypothetical protein
MKRKLNAGPAARAGGGDGLCPVRGVGAELGEGKQGAVAVAATT